MSGFTRDHGNAAAELVLLTPALVICAVFVFWCGRLGQARTQVDLAAESGARAASMVRRTRMTGVGRSTALSSLERNGVVCGSVSAAVDVLEDRVRVTVRCATDADGLKPFGSKVVSATAVAPIDRYRGE